MSEKKLNIACVIPARLASTRLEGKILKTIEGQSLVERVYHRAKKSGFFDHIVVAIDDEGVGAFLKEKGIPCLMTSPAHPSGTDRLVELRNRGKIKADFYVNWQADEPLLPDGMLLDFLARVKTAKSDVITLRRQIQDEKSLHSPDVVKVVTDQMGRALYFSRSPIPFYRENIPFKEKKVFEHIGLYGFFDSALSKIGKLPCSFLESCEKLEQLKFLEHGLTIEVATTRFHSIGIDTHEDLQLARTYFKNHSKLFL